MKGVGGRVILIQVIKLILLFRLAQRKNKKMMPVYWQTKKRCSCTTSANKDWKWKNLQDSGLLHFRDSFNKGGSASCAWKSRRKLQRKTRTSKAKHPQGQAHRKLLMTPLFLVRLRLRSFDKRVYPVSSFLLEIILYFTQPNSII